MSSPQEKWERGIDSSGTFTEDMLVEREVRDRYSIAWLAGPDSGVTEVRELLVSPHPQKVRVRSLKVSTNSVSPSGATVFSTLVVLAEGLTYASLEIPSGTTPVYDLWEPASSIIWSDVGHVYYGTNETIFFREWYGDGRVIDLKVGDRILWLSEVALGGNAIQWGVLDLDVIK